MIFKYEGWVGGSGERGGRKERERDRQREREREPSQKLTPTHAHNHPKNLQIHTQTTITKTNLKHVLTVDMSKSLKCRLQVVESLKMKQRKCHSS